MRLVVVGRAGGDTELWMEDQKIGTRNMPYTPPRTDAALRVTIGGANKSRDGFSGTMLGCVWSGAAWSEDQIHEWFADPLGHYRPMSRLVASTIVVPFCMDGSIGTRLVLDGDVSTDLALDADLSTTTVLDADLDSELVLEGDVESRLTLDADLRTCAKDGKP